MTTQTKKQTLKEKYDLKNSYDLCYVDYRDQLEDFKLIEKVVRDGNTLALEELNWWWEQEADSVYAILKELGEIHSNIPEEDKERIEEWIYDHNISEPVKDLLRHTPSLYFYYSLGIYDSGMVLEGGENDDTRIKAILKRLGRYNEETKKVVGTVVANSSYGGEVVIVFEDDVEDMLKEGGVIEFGEKAELCIMDRFNGSGHSHSLGFPLICAFDRRNLHCDRGASGYSYTHNVCGLVEGFMDGGIIRTKREGEKVLPVMFDGVSLKKMTREEELEMNWEKTKKCITGDMNYSRHPQESIEYIDNFPCGNKCEKCGTFWID